MWIQRALAVLKDFWKNQWKMTRNFEKQFIECFLVLMLPGPHVKSSLLMTWDESELVKSQEQGNLLRGNVIWSYVAWFVVD